MSSTFIYKFILMKLNKYSVFYNYYNNFYKSLHKNVDKSTLGDFRKIPKYKYTQNNSTGWYDIDYSFLRSGRIDTYNPLLRFF